MLPFLLACVKPLSDGVVHSESSGQGVGCSCNTPPAFDALTGFLPGERTGWENAAGGFAVADFDKNGLLDFYLPMKTHDQLYLQREDFQFDEVWDAWSDPTEADDGEAASAIDVDADGDVDLFVGNRDHAYLLRNDGDHFTDAGWLSAEAVHSTGGSWGDVDGDGDLDLALLTHGTRPLEDDHGGYAIGDPNLIFERLEDGSFASHLDALAVADRFGYTFSGGLIDLDDDGVLDLYYVNDFGPQSTPNQFLRGDGTFHFTDAPELGLDVPMYGMGVSVGDLDDDALPDLFVSDWDQMHLYLSGASVRYDAAAARGLGPDLSRDQDASWGSAFADLDNDGDLDIAVALAQVTTPTADLSGIEPMTGLNNPIEQPDALFIQDEEGQFVDAAREWGADLPDANRALLPLDFDSDGVLDLVTRDIYGAVTLLHGGCTGNAWLEVRLSQPGLNPEGIGAVVTVEAGSQRWLRWIRAGESFEVSGPLEAHFGLGNREHVDRVVVRWPDGGTTEVDDVSVRQRIVVERD